MSATDPRVLIAHVLYRFDVGGLENGVVNLINRLPAERYRHAVIALTQVTDFRQRVRRTDVEYHALDKPPGQGIWQYPRLYRLFRALRPAIVHTRNLSALEAVVPAALAGVTARVHGEHGWDVDDLHGRNWRHRASRRLYRPFVTRYVALSRHLGAYLEQGVGVPAERIHQIYNGVDTTHFHETTRGRAAVDGSPFNDPSLWVVGTVGRLQAVKDQKSLIEAVALAARENRAARERLRLVIAGDGPEQAALQELVRALKVQDRVWLPGQRDDVAELMRGFDAFALPSLAEGISNTILEAMATGLPIVATQVGGNVELLTDRMTGRLIAPAAPRTLATALLGLMSDPTTARRMGRAARLDAERRFSLDRMVADYDTLYQSVLPDRRAAGDLGTAARS